MTTSLKALTAAFVLSAVAASVALAHPPKEGREGTDPACKPVGVVLKGDLVSFTTTSFVIDVKRSNKHARALTGQQTIGWDAETKFRPKRYAAFKDAVAGFRVKVKAKACRAASTTTPGTQAPLVAKRIVLLPAKPAEDDDDDETETSTTP